MSGADSTSRGCWLSFALIWTQAGGCGEVLRHGGEGETDPATSQWQPGCVTDALYAPLLQCARHHRITLVVLPELSSLGFSCSTRCSPRPQNPALARRSGAAGLEAVLPDLTQAHHSNSSTFGLLYREPVIFIFMELVVGWGVHQ